MIQVLEAPVAAPPAPGLFTRALRMIVLVLAGVSGVSLLCMMAIVCLDVLLRAVLNAPITGSRDLVSVAAVLVLSGAMPYATAAKGHVTVEYFYSKLPRPAQRIISWVVHLLSLGLFALLAWRAVLYGLMKLKVGEVTPTLLIPVYWLPWVFAVSCAAMVLVILHDLLYPDKEIVKQ